MKFGWITYKVMDLDASIRFFEEIVGLPFSRRMPAGPNSELAFLGDDETQVEIICDKSLPSVENGRDVSIGIYVDSVDEKMNFLKEKNIPIHSGPFTPVPGVKYFFIEDLDGMKIQFFERSNH